VNTHIHTADVLHWLKNSGPATIWWSHIMSH